MSFAELRATEATGLLRGGRSGTHYVSDAVNTSANRARQRLALAVTPQVRVRLQVPAGRLSTPRTIRPKFGMSGGGLERRGWGDIPVRVLSSRAY